MLSLRLVDWFWLNKVRGFIEVAEAIFRLI